MRDEQELTKKRRREPGHTFLNQPRDCTTGPFISSFYRERDEATKASGSSKLTGQVEVQ